MLNSLNVYYNGWGESWLWGTLISSTATTGRPTIAFEYSPEAIQRGVQLSSYLLPLKGLPLRQGFPTYQMGLPGPVYDALPDGWGMLLMDRYFRKIGLHPARIGPLERLTYISTHATGALSFEPCVADMQTSENIPLPQSKKSSKEKVANFYNICWSWVAPPKVPDPKHWFTEILSILSFRRKLLIKMKPG